MAFKKAKKGKFDDISSEWKDGVVGKTTEAINQEIAELAKQSEELRKAKDDDQDLAEKKAQFQEAGAIYRDGLKDLRLKTQYCIQILGDRGAK